MKDLDFDKEHFVEEVFLNPKLGSNFKDEISQDVVIAYNMLDDKRCVCLDKDVDFQTLKGHEEELIKKKVKACKYVNGISNLSVYHYLLACEGFVMFFQGCAYNYGKFLEVTEEWERSRKDVIEKVHRSGIPKKCVVCTRQKFLVFHKSSEFDIDDHTNHKAVEFLSFWFKDFYSRIAGISYHKEFEKLSFSEFLKLMSSFLLHEFKPSSFMLKDWQVSLYRTFSELRLQFGFFCGEKSVIVVLPGRFCVLKVIVPNNDKVIISILPVLNEDVGVNNAVMLNFLLDYVGRPLKNMVMSAIKGGGDSVVNDQFAISVWHMLNSPDYLSEMFALAKAGIVIQ